MTNADIAQQIAEKLEGLDHKAWVQSLSHTTGSMGIVINVMSLLMLLFYLLLIKPQQSNMKELLLNMWINKLTHYKRKRRKMWRVSFELQRNFVLRCLEVAFLLK